MFVQWCIKGVAGGDEGISDAEADAMTIHGGGILSNWLRMGGPADPADVRARLTPHALDRHLHDYDNFKHETPFISLTAGCVERDVVWQLNRLHEAQDVALRFATDWGRRPGYLFHAWVLVGLNPAVEIESVAEEVRSLNTYTRWSDYQLEGEITAKLQIPANQIERWERWEPSAGVPQFMRGRINLLFDPPQRLVNLRASL